MPFARWIWECSKWQSCPVWFHIRAIMQHPADQADQLPPPLVPKAGYGAATAAALFGVTVLGPAHADPH